MHTAEIGKLIELGTSDVFTIDSKLTTKLTLSTTVSLSVLGPLLSTI